MLAWKDWCYQNQCEKTSFFHTILQPQINERLYYMGRRKKCSFCHLPKKRQIGMYTCCLCYTDNITFLAPIFQKLSKAHIVYSYIIIFVIFKSPKCINVFSDHTNRLPESQSDRWFEQENPVHTIICRLLHTNFVTSEEYAVINWNTESLGSRSLTVFDDFASFWHYYHVVLFTTLLSVTIFAVICEVYDVATRFSRGVIHKLLLINMQ